MRNSQIRAHKKQFFSVTLRPAPQGGFQATFIVHGATQAATRIDEWNPPRFFDTEQEAISAAEVRACDWIDANPLPD